MLKVGVIRGGISNEYENSLSSGGNILLHLRNEKLNNKYKAFDILVDKAGIWHLNGIPVNFKKLAESIDVAINTLHGEFGQDGEVQRILESYNIPYTGSNSLSSEIVFNKDILKKHLKKNGIKTPRHIIIPAYQKDFDGDIENYAQKKAHEVFNKFSPPWIIKPLTSGSSLAIHVCKTLPELVRVFKLEEILKISVIVEEMIIGKQANISVLKNFRGKELYATLPGNFSAEEKKELESLATHMHSTLGLGHFSQSEFVVSPKKGIYALHISTLPVLTQNALLEKHLSDIGVDTIQFIEHIIALALE
jgi:D-alanine-D-alanine ligase